MLANAPLASPRPSDGLWKMSKRGNGAILKLPVHKCRVACLGKTRLAGLCRVVLASLVQIPSLQTPHQSQDETWTARAAGQQGGIAVGRAIERRAAKGRGKGP